jgi:hypothetical protein
MGWYNPPAGGGGGGGVVAGSPSYYGLFVSTANQTNSGATTANVTNFDTTPLNSGITVVSSNKITFANAGQYCITAELNIRNSSGSNPTVYMWLSQNGSNLANSSQDTQFQGGAGDVQLVGFTWIVNAAAGDYVQVYWSCSATTVSLSYQAAGVNPTRPASPSALVTVFSLPQIGVATVNNYTTNTSLTSAQSYGISTNSGASGSVTLTLPAAAIGLQYTFVVVAAQTLQINVTGGSVIIGLGEIASSAGGNISSNSPYSAVSLLCLSSTLWAATSIVGTWSPA